MDADGDGSDGSGDSDGSARNGRIMIMALMIS